MEITQGSHSATQAKDEAITDSAADYRFWRKLSRCVKCHTRDAFTINGRCMCAECADKKAAYQRARRREHPEIRESQSLSRKTRRDRLKKAGICVSCGKRKAVSGNLTCVYCAAKHRLSQRSSYAKRHADETKRGTDGMCYRCRRKPPMQGHRLCANCYQQSMEHCRKLNREAHPWRMDDHKMYAETNCT